MATCGDRMRSRRMQKRELQQLLDLELQRHTNMDVEGHRPADGCTADAMAREEVDLEARRREVQTSLLAWRQMCLANREFDEAKGVQRLLRYVSVDLAQRIARMNEMMDAFEEAGVDEYRDCLERLNSLPSGVDEAEEQRAAEAVRTAEAETADEAEEEAALSFADGLPVRGSPSRSDAPSVETLMPAILVGNPPCARRALADMDYAALHKQLEGYATTGDMDGVRATLDELQQRPAAGELKVRARPPARTHEHTGTRTSLTMATLTHTPARPWFRPRAQQIAECGLGKTVYILISHKDESIAQMARTLVGEWKEALQTIRSTAEPSQVSQAPPPPLESTHQLGLPAPEIASETTSLTSVLRTLGESLVCSEIADAYTGALNTRPRCELWSELIASMRDMYRHHAFLGCGFSAEEIEDLWDAVAPERMVYPAIVLRVFVHPLAPDDVATFVRDLDVAEIARYFVKVESVQNSFQIEFRCTSCDFHKIHVRTGTAYNAMSHIPASHIRQSHRGSFKWPRDTHGKGFKRRECLRDELVKQISLASRPSMGGCKRCRDDEPAAASSPVEPSTGSFQDIVQELDD